MTTIEKACTSLAVVLVLCAAALLVLGENVLGATTLALGAAFYVYATTPHDRDEHVRGYRPGDERLPR